MFELLLICVVFCSRVVCATEGSIEIVPQNNGTITTFLGEVKLQSISFTKRSINLTTGTSLMFRVNGLQKIKSHLLQWSMNGVDITGNVKRYQERPSSPPELMYSVESENPEGFSTVTLYLKNRRLVPGVYSLSVISPDSVTPIGFTESYVLAAPTLPLFSKVRKVLDGDPLTLFCKVTGYPLPEEVIWKFSHIKPEAMEDSVALTDAFDNLAPLTPTSSDYKFSTIEVTNDQLVFEKLPREFSGLYGCYVTGENNETDQTLILVNIKDRWAALWPFIGIVIEVTLLVSGILLYERHQMRSRATKNEQVATAEPISPSAVPQTTNATQQNSIPAADGLHSHDKSATGDAGEENPDDIRQRVAPQC